MEAHLADWIRNTPEGREAESILRACVHCGFCNATCPTYQLTGDELDGPRGRIYQIKRLLEGETPGASTQLHLDRCLTCRNCETTCPSGVDYGHLVDIGRATMAQRLPRSGAQRAQRGLLRFALTRRWLFAPAVRIGRALRGVLPSALRAKLPPARDAGKWPRGAHTRKVLLLNGCAQPALMPGIDAATARVLDRCGIEAVVAANSGCCGALDFHLDAHSAAQAKARRNIDAWLPQLDARVEAIVINASGCSAMVKDYAHLLRADPDYADKARRIVAATRDLAEFLPPLLQPLGARRQLALPQTLRRVALHPPCTLQHAQKISGAVENALTALGAELAPVDEAHLCCGSAGTYSILQAEFSQRLRDRKLDNLQRHRPAMILSANIGCLAHLEGAAQVPVRHWIEWVDAVLARQD
ncbi:MAG: glycolate oxidase subunit GlcF [Proteobacteria bacterium]|nr:glycolate oxidase subunit GlcF [Pseudomonadota bacterium]MBS0567966.1 glycolate oxidase subunit GlcF [Pseudomonadota bacterium]